MPWQKRLYEHWLSRGQVPALINIPTGLGKTSVIPIWLIALAHGANLPRRLAYCLPMRVLVEQTAKKAKEWIEALNKHRLFASDVKVFVLMGGEAEEDWDLYPERPAIIIGTQDMLLSRALNRGYAASRARWPMQFGLLNTDCLWVFDEVQLMGSGLATTAQLEAFRRQLTGVGGPKDNGCASVWMSATLRPDWLKTVDFKRHFDEGGCIDGREPLSLTSADHTNEEVQRRWNAKKPLSKAESQIDDPSALAAEVCGAHKPGTRTIVVVNTVRRACALYEALQDQLGVRADAGGAPSGRRRRRRNEAARTQPDAGADTPKPKLVLLHSRFRPPDRAERIEEALAKINADGPGTIIVSTQAIEAGVDVSATTLFTELAPWASLVQRFGRCNRRGEFDSEDGSTLASVRWIDLPTKDADAEKVRHPYELADLRAAAAQLEKLHDVGLRSLDSHQRGLTERERQGLFPHEHTHVIRRKDLIDLFDTTPDLAGNDIDIDRYVREVEETDVRVFWRDWGDPKKGATPNGINGEGPAGGTPRVEPEARRDELCPVGIGDFKSFAQKERDWGRVWRWNFTERVWDKADPESIAPGQVFLVHRDAGGYSAERGWTGDSSDIPSLDDTLANATSQEAEGYDDDHESQTDVWQTIAEHTDKVCRELDAMVTSLPVESREQAALRAAARWHDWGKAHSVFQAAVRDDGRPSDQAGLRTIAKAPEGFWQRYERRHFRHELASALAVLQRPHDALKSLSDEDLNLVAYLIAAHHGKVRLSIRSMPYEQRPVPRSDDGGRERRFARGVWDGDVLGVRRDGVSEYEPVDLGAGVLAPVITLSLEPMEMGLGEGRPLKCFKDQPSWAERMIRLRDALGPFRLAYLEALLRAADIRASKAAGQRAAASDWAAAASDTMEHDHG
jgi:CRISPR-associated endonuclease/helicase Cas3